MPTLKLGDWIVHTLETGSLGLDGGAMFGSVPKPLWSRTNPPDERNRIRLAMRCLLLEGHGHRILVDVGMGKKFSAKLMDIYAVESSPTLEDSLLAIDVEPASITDVVLTHLHFDHAGGATVLTPSGLAPRFPAARWFVQRRNWENAHAPNHRERASYNPENFDALEAAGILELWDGPQAPWPGVTILTAEGHTRGQQLVRVEGGGEVVYFVADLIPTAAHVRIPFVMGYDMACIETMEEKRALLTRAATERAWICLEHDPGIALARPVAMDDDFGFDEKIRASNTVAS